MLDNEAEQRGCAVTLTKEDLTGYAEIQSVGSTVQGADGAQGTHSVMVSTMPHSVLHGCPEVSSSPAFTRETTGHWGERQHLNWQPQCGQNTERHAERSVSREGPAWGPGPGLRTHSWGALVRCYSRGALTWSLSFTSQILTKVAVNLNGMLY